MSTQISLKLSDNMFNTAKTFAELKGFDNLQDFIRETLREILFEEEKENMGGLFTYAASEKTLAKQWLSKKEDEAWAHLKKEI